MLKGRPTIDGRPGESLEPLDFDALKKKLQDEYGTIHLLTLLLVIFQSPPDWRTGNSKQYFLLRCGIVIWNLAICIWGIISLRLSFPLVKVRRLILSFPERGCSQISTKNSKFYFVKCWNTNCTNWKYYQRGLLWMVTLQGFLHRLKSWLHHLIWEGKGQVIKWPARKSFKTLLFDYQRISKRG